MAIKKIFNFPASPAGGQFSIAKRQAPLIFKKNSWLESKTKLIRKFSLPRAARATRTARKHLAVILAVAFSVATLASAILPKSQIQTLKERLVHNPDDFEAHLQLAEKFLENNQLEEAERALALAQKTGTKSNQVLGEKISQRFDDLWQQKQYSDPADIQRLITTWEKIVEEKPNYRDGWLQLTVLYYKLYQNDKAKASLKKALYIDPNYEPTRELEKIIY